MTRDDASTGVWNIVEPTLLAHIRRYARNFGLLKKSKEEVLIDMTLRAEDGDLDNIEVLDAPILLKCEGTSLPSYSGGVDARQGCSARQTAGLGSDKHSFGGTCSTVTFASNNRINRF
jgi:hypothetical protein